MNNEIVSNTYEICPSCTDGSCGRCGQASGEHAAPGVRMVVRRFRFVRCSCEGNGCNRCGPAVHEMAGRGIRTEIIGEHATKRWVPSVHFVPEEGRKAACGVWAPSNRTTKKREDATCKVCLRRNK
jgi:hypothetical protein